MLYYFELQLVGAILLTAMAAGGISLWIKRRKARQELEQAHDAEPGNSEL